MLKPDDRVLTGSDMQGIVRSTHLLFFPAIPPNTVSGTVTSDQIMVTITMVPNGKAAVDCTQGEGIVKTSAL